MNALAFDYGTLTWQSDPLHWSTKYFLRQFVFDNYSRRLATAARFVSQSASAFRLVLDMLARGEPAIDRHRSHARLGKCVAEL